MPMMIQNGRTDVACFNDHVFMNISMHNLDIFMMFPMTRMA